MKKIVGYLIDRATGLGISGKTVAFQKLDGSSIASSDTYYLDKSSATDASGRFYANMELSPGPVNVLVTVSGSEVKVRKHDEMAKLGALFSSDISLLARARTGVIRGFLDEMALSFPSGHTIRIGKGAAIFNGNIFSIEQAAMDIVGTANTNAAINPRLDLITLRQYNESAAGQLAGKQEVIVTLGAATNVVPAVPTGADFTDFPLGVVATAYNGSTKTLYRDDRAFTNTPAAHTHNVDISRVVVASAALPPNTYGSSTATCPSGYVTTGGGCSTVAVTGGAVNVAGTYQQGSYPIGSTQWGCNFYNASSVQVYAEARAICAKLPTEVNV